MPVKSSLPKMRPKTRSAEVPSMFIGCAAPSASAAVITRLAPPSSDTCVMAPESGKVTQGFAREDLFCVVHDLFRTDSQDTMFETSGVTPQ